MIDHDPRGCDEHMHCVCGAAMSYNTVGTVVCPDCDTDALAAEVPAEVVAS
jgi:hypothetical protein